MSATFVKTMALTKLRHILHFDVVCMVGQRCELSNGMRMSHGEALWRWRSSAACFPANIFGKPHMLLPHDSLPLPPDHPYDCMVSGELGMMLDGHLPNRTDLSGSLSRKTPGYVAAPSLAQRMHCLLMCIPAPSATDPSCTSRLQELKQFAAARGELLHAAAALL
jgi:hypothetical protein